MHSALEAVQVAGVAILNAKGASLKGKIEMQTDKCIISRQTSQIGIFSLWRPLLAKQLS